MQEKRQFGGLDKKNGERRPRGIPGLEFGFLGDGWVHFTPNRRYTLKQQGGA
jgi:hypothetical protein